MRLETPNQGTVRSPVGGKGFVEEPDDSPGRVFHCVRVLGYQTKTPPERDHVLQAELSQIVSSLRLRRSIHDQVLSPLSQQSADCEALSLCFGSKRIL